MKYLTRVLYGISFVCIAAYSFSGDFPTFATLDHDQDGKISAQEASASPVVAKLFSFYDLDKSMSLSAEEYRQLQASGKYESSSE